LRTSRAIRVPRRRIQSSRFQSTGPSTTQSNPAVTGAVAGAAASVILGYAWYHFSGTKSVVQTAKQTKQYMQSAQDQFKKQVQDKAPDPNEALRWLRQVSTYYAGFIPGASGFVETTFDDLDKIRSKHGDEVDKIVGEAYEELKGVSQKDLSLSTAQQAWEVIQKHTKRIAELAGDAAEDILNNHPQIKNAVGGSIDQLKSMGDSYGPEAKKQVEETWDQIKDIVKGGLSADSAIKIKKLVEDKTQQLKKMGDELWKKGMEQAKPYLDKNPQVKEIVENNADALKKGNFQELYEKIKQAVESGSTGDLEKYVKSAKDKAQEKVGGLDQYAKMIPGGDQVWSKFGQLQDIAKSKGPEAQKLMEDTVKEIGDILSKKSEQAKKLGEKAKNEAK